MDLQDQTVIETGNEQTVIDTEAILDEIQRAADNLKNMVRLDPTEMAGPIQTFISQLDNLKTNTAVVSALQSFWQVHWGSSKFIYIKVTQTEKNGLREG